MPQSNSTFFEEALDAARGTWALVFGRPDAARYFDFSQRGLVGSFIALVLAVTISVYGPMLFGAPTVPGAATGAMLLSALVFALQIGAAYLVLQTMGRLDGLVPYLVADNWVNFFVSAVGAVSVVLLGGSGFVMIIVGVAAIIIEVNIARRIVTLAPMQIAIFIIAQMAASFVGLLVMGGALLGAMGPPA